MNAPRTTERGSATREKILEVAEELIDRHGMEGLRLSEVAERVGIRPPSIFAHFEGREGLGDAVARRVTGQIGQLFAGVLAGRGDPVEILVRGVRAFAGHLYDHPAHVRLLLRDLARTRQSGDLNLPAPFVDGLAGRMGALIDEGARGGLCGRIGARELLVTLLGALLARLSFGGYDEEGQPRLDFDRAAFQAEAERLMRRSLYPQP